jgi:hypothetical protein
MNRTDNNLTQVDDDIDRTVEDEVRRVRMDAILTWAPRKHARPSHEGQNAISSIGKAWARSGLLAGKDALKTSASTLEKAAGLLNHLAKTCKKEDDAIKV